MSYSKTNWGHNHHFHVDVPLIRLLKLKNKFSRCNVFTFPRPLPAYRLSLPYTKIVHTKVNEINSVCMKIFHFSHFCTEESEYDVHSLVSFKNCLNVIITQLTGNLFNVIMKSDLRHEGTLKVENQRTSRLNALCPVFVVEHMKNKPTFIMRVISGLFISMKMSLYEW